MKNINKERIIKKLYIALDKILEIESAVNMSYEIQIICEKIKNIIRKVENDWLANEMEQEKQDILRQDL